MDNIYLYMVIGLAILAIADLVVGVSNDAVNFLNSAIGSKAVSFKTIMIVASIGVAVGAMTSSGMMEVARKGIFNPGEFMFDEIMIIFLAVMLTDIILLDFFNSLGLPTSTTVSIVFELLGASVAVAFIKINQNELENLLDLPKYINNDQAVIIILGILLSVVVAFSVGALVQYVSRLLLTFDFQKKHPLQKAIFSGFANAAILYFILIKGLKNATFLDEGLISDLTSNLSLFLLSSFAICTIISYILIQFFKQNIFTIIIIIGTFALAVAFSGNDLVNFIGVPMAGIESYEEWLESGVAPSLFSMDILSQKIPTKGLLLFIAGLIMVATLWFSSKAKAVVKTSVDLSRQGEGEERFKPNLLSQAIVRGFVNLSNIVVKMLPDSFLKFSNQQFKKVTPAVALKPQDKPAFDLVRAAVNLMVASVLISIATSMKLPLSTTYVTFMVAMGASLADRAWGTESAVYRVAGVINVIGGWFFTALSAFTAAAIMAVILYFGGTIAFIGLFILAIFLISRSYMNHRKKAKVIIKEDKLERAESSSTQGVINESASNIAAVVRRTNNLYEKCIKGLSTQNLKILKENKKQVEVLLDEIEILRNDVFYFIKKLEEPSVNASDFYINILSYLQDLAQSLEYIAKSSYKHINNNHKKLKFSQVKELKSLYEKLSLFLVEVQVTFEKKSFENIYQLLKQKPELLNFVKQKIKIQVERTRNEESSPKNTTLYFGILSETKDILNVTMDLLEEYYRAYDASVEPAKV